MLSLVWSRTAVLLKIFLARTKLLLSPSQMVSSMHSFLLSIIWPICKIFLPNPLINDLNTLIFQLQLTQLHPRYRRYGLSYVWGWACYLLRQLCQSDPSQHGRPWHWHTKSGTAARLKACKCFYHNLLKLNILAIPTMTSNNLVVWT